MKRLRKVKWDGEAVLIAYDRITANEEPDHVEVRSSDPPAAEFTAALAKLAPHVVALCEFDDLDMELEVRGVSFTYDKSGTQGAVITALKPLLTSPSPLVLNTPHKPFDLTNEEMPLDFVMKDEQIKALRAVERQAWAYLAGVRDQGDLFRGPEMDAAVAAARRLDESLKRDGVTATITAEGHEPVTLGAGT